MGKARGRLNERVVHAAILVRALLAVSRNRGVDELRVDLREGCVIDSELSHDPRPIVFEQYVGGRHELQEDLHVFLTFEVEDERALVPVEYGVHPAHPRARAAEKTSRIAEKGRLDLDDVGSLIREDHSGHGPRDSGSQLKHSVVGQGASHSWISFMDRVGRASHSDRKNGVDH